MQIGNDNFAWFGTTQSKSSRLNFLDLPHAHYTARAHERYGVPVIRWLRGLSRVETAMDSCRMDVERPGDLADGPALLNQR